MPKSVRQLKGLLRKQAKAALSRIPPQELIDQSARIALTLRQLPVYRNARNVGFYMNMDQSEVKTLLLIKNAFEDGKNIFLPRCMYELTLTLSKEETTKHQGGSNSKAGSSNNGSREPRDPAGSSPNEPSNVTGSGAAIPPLDFSLSAKKNHLVFYRVPDFDAVMRLEPDGPYNLREPSKDTAAHCFRPPYCGLDLLVMPAVAYSISASKRIKRLGHGAGFYDEFIKRHKQFTEHLNSQLEGMGQQKRQLPFLLGLGLEEQLVEDVPTDDLDEDLDGLLVQDRFYHFK